MKDMYMSLPLPLLGLSDHNLVSLVPQYQPLVQHVPPIRKSMGQWDKAYVDTLQDCFEATDWNVFVETLISPNQLTA